MQACTQISILMDLKLSSNQEQPIYQQMEPLPLDSKFFYGIRISVLTGRFLRSQRAIMIVVKCQSMMPGPQFFSSDATDLDNHPSAKVDNNGKSDVMLVILTGRTWIVSLDPRFELPEMVF